MAFVRELGSTSYLSRSVAELDDLNSIIPRVSLILYEDEQEPKIRAFNQFAGSTNLLILIYTEASSTPIYFLRNDFFFLKLLFSNIIPLNVDNRN